MIKAKGIIGGRQMILFGLSRANMDALLDDKPIRFDLEDIGIVGVGVVVILGGETEEDIKAQLETIYRLPEEH